MKNLLLLFAFCPLLVFSQHSGELAKKYIPANTVALDHHVFIGQTEITNRMYHEFVSYVLDSVFTDLLYDSLPYDRAKYFLNVPEKSLKNLTADKRPEYAKIYGLNYSYYKTHLDWDSLCYAKAKSLYHPESARFYHRREVNINKLLYTMSPGELVPVYPDTLSWVNDYYVKYDSSEVYDYVGSATNMYFWHPAYDNYPVVGLNFQQIQAFCHWYGRQLNKNSRNVNLHYSVSIPSLADYTKAMQLCVAPVIKPYIGPEHLINPILYTRTGHAATYHIHKAYGHTNYSFIKEKDQFVMQEWEKVNAISPTLPPDKMILNLLDGPAEVVQNPKEPDYMTILGGDYYLGIVDPNGIQANTLFYQRLLYKNQGYSFVGFRVLVTVTSSN